MEANDRPVPRGNGDDLDEGLSGCRRSGRLRSRGTPFESLVDFVARRAETVGDSLRTLAALRKDRTQLAVRRRKQALIVAVVVGVAGGTALIHAMILLVGGMAAGMERLFAGAPWLGDIVSGLVVLGLLAAGLTLSFRAENRHGLEESRAKYARSRDATEEVDVTSG